MFQNLVIIKNSFLQKFNSKRVKSEMSAKEPFLPKKAKAFLAAPSSRFLLASHEPELSHTAIPESIAGEEE